MVKPNISGKIIERRDHVLMGFLLLASAASCTFLARLWHRVVLSAISYQPVAFTGRISRHELEKKRYTLGDLAHDLARLEVVVDQADVVEAVAEGRPVLPIEEADMVERHPGPALEGAGHHQQELAGKGIRELAARQREVLGDALDGLLIRE